MRPRRGILAAIAVSLLLAAGCGDDSADGPIESGERPETTAEPATTTAADDPADDPAVDEEGDSDEAAADGGAADAALEFFRSTEATCAEFADSVGNPRVDPSRFAGASIAADLGDGTWLVVDGAGDELVVDPVEGVVQPVGGPDDVLPREYSFGCPAELFLGTLPG